MNNKAVNPIPEGYHTITPYMMISDARGCMDFMKQAFDAEEINCHNNEDGSVMHATMRIGNSMIMISSGSKDYPAMPAMYYLYVPDTDAVYRKAIAAGGKSLREPTDEYYGDRSAGVADKWGNQWWIGTHMEDVSEDEMEKRQAEMRNKQTA